MTPIYFIPQNRTQLYLFWFLVDNAGKIMPYDEFWKISEVYSVRQRIQQAIGIVRPILELNGFSIETIFDVGYKVRKETR